MEQKFTLWVNNQNYSYKLSPICKMSKLFDELVKKGIFQFIFHESINEQDYNSFINACLLKPFKVDPKNCFKLLDISEYLAIPALNKFVIDYIIARGVIRPTTYYSSIKLYEFIIHVKLLDIQPIQDYIDFLFYINDMQKSVIIITPYFKSSNLPQEVSLVSKDFNSDIIKIDIKYSSKKSMQIRLIDHKIGETFVYNNNFDIKDKQSPKIHFEINFIPHLRSYISDDSLSIKADDKNKEIQQLKDQ